MSVFDELRAHASLPFEQARMLPLEAYSSTEVLDAELATVFAQDWQCVARTADVEDVGDYVCADLPVPGGGMRSIVVIRVEDSIRAFDNVCIHRGAQLLTGCGNEARITCPYHAWAYRHDGSLIGGPYMTESTEADGAPFSPDRHRLPEVRLEVWNGFVFVNLDEAAPPMGEVYPGLAEELDRLAFDDGPLGRVDRTVFEIAGNWKNVGDNLLECYHCHPAHPGFVDLIDMAGYRNECHENWSVQSGPVNPDTAVYDTGTGAATFSSVFVWPNVSIGHLPGQRGRFVFQFFPTGPEQTEQTMTYYGPDGTRTVQECGATDWFNTVLGPEDVALVENAQRGLRSKGYDQGRFICIPDRPELSEHAVHHFHAMVVDALDGSCD